jgi:NAD(P)H-dependent FMN reductase
MNAFSYRADIKVLALVGSRKGAVHRQLLKLPVQMAAAGIKLMIGELGCMPIYREDIDSAELPDSVAALRVTAAEADAALILSPVNGTRSPALRNAIDWLTQPGNGELQDKPLAVLGGAVGGFVGVWSHPAGRDASHVIEKIAVADLGEMVYRLAAEVSRAPIVFEAGGGSAVG